MQDREHEEWLADEARKNGKKRTPPARPPTDDEGEKGGPEPLGWDPVLGV
ncbi:MAG: hypothetical protein HYS26_02600 [Candidatus Kaiserbacteria bacterium]|nr:MAG: hypothetical protein HYS26_02600 [Candidatus Kaiserbacteria bacterium]